jgi:hypothetical protein
MLENLKILFKIVSSTVLFSYFAVLLGCDLFIHLICGHWSLVILSLCLSLFLSLTEDGMLVTQHSTTEIHHQQRSYFLLKDFCLLSFCTTCLVLLL